MPRRRARLTISSLQRRRSTVARPPRFIGKESNKLEQVEEGGVPAESDVYTVYDDPQRDEWITKWLPMLRSTPIPELLGQGVSRARIYAARVGRKAYSSTKARFISILRSYTARRCQISP